MKRILSLLILFTPLFSFGQFTAIPDANFEQALIDLGHDTGTPDGQVLTANISGVTSLVVSNDSISDLTGIEDFAALEELYCVENQLTSLDVTQNTALTYLDFRGNQLTSLDVTQNIALETLECGTNQLTNLDVTQNTALLELDCRNNQLTSLDVTQNTALYKLWFTTNQLTSLDVTQNTALRDIEFMNNQLTSLDVTQNTALRGLDCRNNQLTILDLIQNTALTHLECNSNQLTSLDLTQNTALVSIWCAGNQLTCLNVKNGNNDIITDFLAFNNPALTCIEVDDVAWSTANWTVAGGHIDAGVTFSTNCSNACSGIPTTTEEYSNQPRKLIRILDLLGRETNFKPNTPLIYQYDDGSVEKVIREY